MLEITQTASENLKNYLEQNSVESAVRIALMEGGCSGAALGLALDSQKETDESFMENELQFIIEKELLAQCGSIKVDYIDAGYRSGFSITSSNPVGNGGGCSSGGCASGSCCG